VSEIKISKDMPELLLYISSRSQHDQDISQLSEDLKEIKQFLGLMKEDILKELHTSPTSTHVPRLKKSTTTALVPY
jgi:hypothetical protein